MRIRCAWAVLAFAAASHVVAAELAVKPSPQQKEAATWAARVLDRYRYQPAGSVQPSPEKAFDAYLKALDREKMVFTHADIAPFEALRSRVDKITDGSELDIAFAIFDSYQTRLAELITYAKSVLRQPLDFTGKERFQRVRAQAARAGSEDALRTVWRQRVTDDYLNLRLAGCAEKDIIPTLERRYDSYLARARATTSAERMELFMTAYAQSLDPDASYLAPKAGQDQARLGGMAGAGIVIQKQGDLIEVREMAPGGAAARSKLVKPGDRIIGIAQGAGQPVIEVIGAGVDTAVDLLRGAPGSPLVLEILPADAPTDGARKRVALVRDQPGESRNVARSRVEVVTHEGATFRVGVIVIPTFYQDYAARRAGAKEFTSMSRDVANLLQTLAHAKVDAVLLDLRNNGGGPLDEASRLAGLFVPGAPYAQQRTSDGKVTVETAADGVPAWDGLLGVLIDNGSAAATEIFAAAMQDYGRGIVIGDTSVGRGTVQSILSLDRFSSEKNAGLGELKMTVAQWFRVDGSTVQQRGVIPDIVVPGVAAVSGKPAFQGRPIKAVDIRKHGELSALLPNLSARHNARILASPPYRTMLRARAEAEAQRDKDEVSLNESERRRLRDAHVSVNTGQVQLEEALQIMGDEIDLLRNDASLARRVRATPAGAR